MAAGSVVIADDHSLIREGLRGVLERADRGLRVTGEASCGAELLKMLETTPCDVVVLDIAMPGMDGLTALREVRRRFPEIRILILSMYIDFDHFRQAKNLGASGYLDKNDAVREIVPAIEALMQGRDYRSPSIVTLLADRQIRTMESGTSPSIEILTRREREVLRLIAQGLANKNIAAKLRISVHTVENHRAHLAAKLNLKNGAMIVKYAIEKGLA